MKDQDQALAILDQALAAVTAEGCDAADAVLWCSRNALTRFANNTIHQNVATESDTLCLRAVRGQRTGCVRTGVLTPDGLSIAARKAAAIAGASPEEPEFPGILASPTAEPCGVADPATAECTPAQRAEAVRQVIGTVEGGGAVASGALSTSLSHVAAANTAGTRQFDRQTEVNLSVVAMDGTAAGCAEFTSARLAEMDAKERAEFALRKCLDSREAGVLEPGEYTVVLEPAAAGELFQFLAYLGLGAQAMQQEQSCLQGKLGQQLFDQRLTVVDDPHDPNGEPFAFDGEGVPTQRVELITDGVFKAIAYDQKTAKKDGVKSTGNGNVPPATHGPFPNTMLVSPGDATPAEMIASTEHGLLVSNFHYTNVAERSTCSITGMTRYGLFEIRDGRVTRPVKNLRFTQSVLAALNDLAAIGSERERFGPMLVPALKINRFRFTGKSDH